MFKDHPTMIPRIVSIRFFLLKIRSLYITLVCQAPLPNHSRMKPGLSRCFINKTLRPHALAKLQYDYMVLSFPKNLKEAVMCEFCIQHGEGKQWYLAMKNYSQELMHAPLTSLQKQATGFDTRLGWMDYFLKSFLLPSVGMKSTEIWQEEQSTEPPPVQLSQDEILSRNKTRHFGQVLPIEDVEKVLTLTDSITRVPCGCRYFNAGVTNARYCFGLGVDAAHILGEYPDCSASFEVLSKDEAMKLIGNFDDEGLIHSVWTGVTPYVFGLCNCDGDCDAYRGYIKDQGLPTFFRAEYICQVDLDQCNGCKECMSQCQFGAQFYSSALGKVTIEPKLCFGCGVCRAACPQNAIELVPREKVPAVANIW
jgi:Pyruvate/2-oxoacid:ferredoxin oxidoreductase delta subunit